MKFNEVSNNWQGTEQSELQGKVLILPKVWKMVARMEETHAATSILFYDGLLLWKDLKQLYFDQIQIYLKGNLWWPAVQDWSPSPWSSFYLKEDWRLDYSLKPLFTNRVIGVLVFYLRASLESILIQEYDCLLSCTFESLNALKHGLILFDGSYLLSLVNCCTPWVVRLRGSERRFSYLGGP
jgi:hypothetical protein